MNRRLLPDVAAQTVGVGQNLDSITDYTSSPAFVNSMKFARPWMTRNADSTGWDTGHGDYSDLGQYPNPNSKIPKRADGYPSYVPFAANGVNQWVHPMVPIFENGSHRILIQGSGLVLVNGPGIGTQEHTLSGSKDFTVTISGANNLSAFDTSGLGVRNEPSYFYMVIKQSSSGDSIRNIRIMRPGQHNASKDALDPALLANLQPYSVIRFMDWQRTNNNTGRTTWNVPENSKDDYTQAATADSLGGTYTNRGAAIDAYSGAMDYVEVAAGTVTFGSAGTKSLSGSLPWSA